MRSAIFKHPTQPSFSAVECRAAGKAHNDVCYDQDDEGNERQQADVLPPHLGLQAPRFPLEGKRLVLQVIGLVHEQLNPLPSVQHLCNSSLLFSQCNNLISI